MNYDWNFSVVFEPAHRTILLQGFGVTLALTSLAIVLGTPLGILLGSLASLGRFASFDLEAVVPRHTWASRVQQVVRWLVVAWIDTIRAIPLLLLILLAYYGLPVLIQAVPGLGSLRLSGFTTSVVALAINLSAFIADLVRSSASAVSRGSVMGARSLGMDRWLVWRRIILPDVVRELIPGLTLLYITIFKMSTLCSTVAVYEFMHSAEAVIQRTYKPLELFVAVAAVFVITIVPLSVIARHLEQSRAFLRRTQ